MAVTKQDIMNMLQRQIEVDGSSNTATGGSLIGGSKEDDIANLSKGRAIRTQMKEETDALLAQWILDNPESSKSAARRHRSVIYAQVRAAHGYKPTKARTSKATAATPTADASVAASTPIDLVQLAIALQKLGFTIPVSGAV